MTKRRHEEVSIQIAIAQFLKLNEDTAIWTYFSVPNGEPRDKASAGKIKAMGGRAGVPDLVIDHLGKITYVEVKTDIGTMSDDQEKWAVGCRKRGVELHIVRSVDDMEGVLKHLGIPIRASVAA